MEVLRKYLWLWVFLVVLLISVFIVLIFICLNSWIRRQGKLVLGLDRSRAFVSETYSKPARRQSPALKTATPPLPPRTQFTTQVPESPSYENLAEEPVQRSVKTPAAEGPYEVPEKDLGPGRERWSQPDYLEVEGGPEPGTDEDYDDIDAEDEDYDDVG